MDNGEHAEREVASMDGMPRRRTPLRPDELVPLCGGPVVLVRQLQELGVNPSTVRRRCQAGGPWRALLPGVVKLTNAPPDRTDRRLGALLYAGPDAVITGLDALDLHGMGRMPAPAGPVHVLVPADRRRVGAGLVLVERTERLPEPEPGRWPLAPIARAALDFARRSRDRDVVRATLAEVVQRGRCTVAQLHAELDAGSGRGSALPRTVLAEVGAGVRSVAEAKARALLRRTALPPALWNPRLHDLAGRFLGTPDAWFDDVAMAWEIDSQEWHLSPDDYRRTVERRAVMTAAGIVLLPTQPSRIAQSPSAVERDLLAHYRQARLRPRPPIRATPATPAGANGTFGR